jgi:hypothetical protein
MIAIKIAGGKIAYVDHKRIILIRGIKKTTMGGEIVNSEIFLEGLKEPVYSIMRPETINIILD